MLSGDDVHAINDMEITLMFFGVMRLHVHLKTHLFYLCAYRLGSATRVLCEGRGFPRCSGEQSSTQLPALRGGFCGRAAPLILLWAGRPQVKAVLGVSVEGTLKMHFVFKICLFLEVLN